MYRLRRPLSSIINRTCTSSIKITPRILISSLNHPRYFSDTKDTDLKSQDANPQLYDPDYVPCEESDFDVDPLDVRLRQPLPAESFIPREDVLKRIIAVCEGMERCKTEGKVVNDTSHLQNDLGLDSLDQVEFGLAIEDEFDIEIPDEEAEQIVTVGDAVDLIADHPHAT
eukprot:35286_1